jgi:CRP/FNR family transcriptional regulator, cyclic AMP receptor protein
MPDVKETVKFLQKVPLFASLNNRQLEHLAKRFVERTYKEGEAIVTQGKGGEGIFIFVSGKAAVNRQRPDGTSILVNEMGPTDFLGELALLDDGLRTASAVVTEPVKCLVLTRWDFLGILKEDADLAIAILQELARRFRRALDAM